jgi:hypothetical protein
VFIASLLRNAAARLFPWVSGSSAAGEISTATPNSGIAIVPVQKIQTAARPKRRPFQPHPTLWAVRSRDAWQKVYCGPTAVAAAIGAEVDEVVRVIQRHRGNYSSVTGTDIGDLRQALWHFGYDLQLVADLSCKSPTLALWERQRTDWEFESALLLIVTGHWVAVRGRWFVDTLTEGRPVRLSDAPRRRKRVRYVYGLNLINENRVVRDSRTGRIIRCV